MTEIPGKNIISAAENNNRSGICLSCGLCCDGTIFLNVEIDDLKLISQHKSLGIDFVILDKKNDGKLYFKQPCPAHRGGRCSIYTDRPIVCRNYQCKILKAYDRGELEISSAIAIIKRAKSQKEKIIKRISELLPSLQTRNILFLLHEEVFAAYKNARDAEFKKHCSDLLLEIGALRFYMSKHFKSIEKK